VNYNGTIRNVASSTTTLTFAAPSLLDDVFSDTVVVMVTAISRFGMGPTSDPVIAKIDSTYVHMYLNSVYLSIQKSMKLLYVIIGICDMYVHDTYHCIVSMYWTQMYHDISSSVFYYSYNSSMTENTIHIVMPRYQKVF